MSALFDALNPGTYSAGMEISPDLHSGNVMVTMIDPDNPALHNMQTSFGIDAAMRLGVQLIFCARLLDSSILHTHHNCRHTHNQN